MSDLDRRLEDPGYTPRARDLPALLERLAGDEDVARRIERVLVRAGARAADAARERFGAAVPPERARLVALVGRVAATTHDPGLADWLGERLEDADPKTRRRAMTALGKLGDVRFEDALVQAFERAAEPPERKAAAQALGHIGGRKALAVLAGASDADPEAARVARESRHSIERRELRAVPSAIRLDRTPARPLDALLHVRAGLEETLLEELASLGVEGARPAGRGRVAVRVATPFSRVFRARTFLHPGFPLPAEDAEDGGLDHAVARALTGEAAENVLRTFGDGPLRYRLDWADAGHRRALTRRVAELVTARRPELVNDATQAPFEAVVSERLHDGRRAAHVELWLRGLADPRFEYREREVPAASQPTLAAALARLGEARPDDVVWDPFVGSGLELIERALLGPYAALFGTDTDDAALDAARRNLERARISRVTLANADARTVRPPEGLSLVLTNPPFGHRVLERGAIPGVLSDALRNAARALVPGGRIVWISPLPRDTAELAAALGLEVVRRIPIDLGGPRGELQILLRGRGPRRSGGASRFRGRPGPG